jgi:hypothetical protein
VISLLCHVLFVKGDDVTRNQVARFTMPLQHG